MTSAAESYLLSSRMFRVTERMKEDFGAIAAEFDLTALQARAVLYLDQPRPMRSVSGHLACEPSNLTGLADRLERAGLVERAPGAPDRRVKLLRLTAEGERLRAALAARVAVASTVMAKLNADERQFLSGLLDRLLE